MPEPDAARLRAIKTFPSLVKYLRDDLDWPIESDDFDELTFDYDPDELGLDAGLAVKIKQIKQLRPLASNQPWGIFFVNFEPKRLPVVALRRILRSLVIKKRASANKAQQPAWRLHDLLFVSTYGESEHRDLTFAHFSEDGDGGLPTLRVLGWDDEDTVLHLGHAHQTLRSRLRWPADEADLDAWRKRWGAAFTLRHQEVIATSKALAVRMAALAGAIRKRVNRVLAVESEKGPLRTLLATFRQALIHDLSDDDFADMYAQTITYGLLTARVSRPAGLCADNVADMVPITNPFLKELMETFLNLGGRRGGRAGGIDFDELGVGDVVDTLRAANMEAVLRDFGDRNPAEDPVIHFYELFLREYDAKKRMQRGVFYTPRPVVSFIVRSVDELLRTEFGLADGLADTTTWGEMKQRFDQKQACDAGFQPASSDRGFQPANPGQEQKPQAGMPAPQVPAPAPFCGAGFQPAQEHPTTKDSRTRGNAGRMPAPQEIMQRSDPPLTAGSCVLRRPDVAEIVQQALLYFEGQRYRLRAWCIMPNHVHVVVQPLPGHPMKDILHSWKSFTATKINRLLQRTGALWERESFDHLIRRPEHVNLFAEYTEHNPVAAGLAASPRQWPFSSCGCGAGFQPADSSDAGFQPAPVEFVAPRETPFVEPATRGELPHLYKEGGTYFITWRLLDAVDLRCGAGFQPASSDRGFQPASSDTTFQPASSDTTFQPASSDRGFQPAPSDTTFQPADSRRQQDGQAGMPAPQVAAPQVPASQSFRIPDGTSPDTPFVQILDPACGTGTFLVEVIGLIHKTMTEKWAAEGHRLRGFERLWNAYVPKHLLPRLHGYELMMAPYAIAHMKIGLKLHETGYRFESDERARVYLTNALEPPSDKQLTLDFLPALAHEAEAVNAIKRDQPFTVVIGNPPYSVLSANLSDTNRHMIDRYRSVAGQKIEERSMLRLEMHLQDDYVKFLALSQAILDDATAGVFGFITNSGYLDNLTLRGVRFSLHDSFSRATIVNLNGSRQRLASRDDETDENVFDIEQGVAIFVGASQSSSAQMIRQQYFDVTGSRERKYNILLNESYSSLQCVTLSPKSPQYFLVPHDEAGLEEYGTWVSIVEAMPVNISGIVTAHDTLVVDFDEKLLIENAAILRDRSLSDDDVRKRLTIKDNAGWKLSSARVQLRRSSADDLYLKPYSYRPFDTRSIYYHRALVWCDRRKVMSHTIARKNIAIATCRQLSRLPWNHVFVTRDLQDDCFISNRTRERSYHFPLYLYSDSKQRGMQTELSFKQDGIQSNFSAGFLTDLQRIVGKSRVSASAALYYVYSVLHCPCYRTKYAELLKIDFPRIPLPSGLALFRALARLGGELVALHLLEDTPTRASWHTPRGAGAQRLADCDAGFQPAAGSEKTRQAGMPAPHCGAGFQPAAGSEKTRQAGMPAPQGPLAHPITTLVGSGEFRVEKVSFTCDAGFQPASSTPTTPETLQAGMPAPQGTVWIDKAQTRGFRGVPEAVWNFHIGGYQVCEKWLKDRQAKGGKHPRPGRILTKDDIDHYQKIVVALNETIRIMGEIDEVIDAHGGWPGAFVTDPDKLKGLTAGAADDTKAADDDMDDCDGDGDGEDAPDGAAGEDDAGAGDGAEEEDDTKDREEQEEEHARADINDYDRDDLVAAIRHVFAQVDRDGLERDEAIRRVARELGFHRTGSRVREAIDHALRAASHRGVVCSEGTRVFADCRSIADYPRDLLKRALRSAMGATWWDREEAITAAARHLGFAKTGKNIHAAFKSAIHGALLQGLLESDGPRIRRTP